MGKKIKFLCPGCSGQHEVLQKLAGGEVWCEECNSEFTVPGRSVGGVAPLPKAEDYRWIYSLYREHIKQNFLDDDYLKTAKNNFASQKWQLADSQKQMQSFFAEYQVDESVSSKEFFKRLKKKFKITLTARSASTKLVAKLHLILSVVYVASYIEENNIHEDRLSEFKKVLFYFIDPNDYIPDTSPSGYLDDLYMFIVGFKGMRMSAKKTVDCILKEALTK